MSVPNQRFQGGVFSDQLEGGRSGAELSFTSQALVATTPDGQLFSVPFRDCHLELGGNSGRMWFCRNADKSVTLFSEAKGFVEALREAGRRELADKLQAVEQSARSDSRRSTMWGLGILAGGVVLLALLALGLRFAGSALVMTLPASVDVKLGKLAIENMDLGGTPSDDPVLKAAVKKVVERLDKAQHSPFRYETRVVESTQVNAFALPGGPIVVYTGLLREAASPEQLAGVLAHEMAHVTRRHGMQRIAQSLGVVSAIQLLFGDVSGVMAVALEVLRAGAINSYSRDAEHEADMDGVQRMHKAKLDANALADFFLLLDKREGGLPSGLSWLGTHPELKQRAKDVRAEAKKLGNSKEAAFDLDWAEVQKRAGKRE